MPKSRQQYRRDRPAPSTVPSVVEALTGRGREWVKRAACAVEPYSNWKWVIEPSSGRMTASTTVSRFEVCATCPVRAECLRDALSETQYSVEGYWGASTRSERTATLHRISDQMRDSDAAIRLPSPIRPEGISSYMDRDARLDAGLRAELVERTAAELEATFETRLNGWRSRQPGWRACEVCGTAFEIPPHERRPKQYCSLSCRQKAYYVRKVRNSRRAPASPTARGREKPPMDRSPVPSTTPDVRTG